jgi:hypothetical protein
MARTPITIRVTPAVLDRLAYLAMRPVLDTDPDAAAASRRRVGADHAADVLDRWARRRHDNPPELAVIEYMTTADPSHAHPDDERTVELSPRITGLTAAALAEDRPKGMDTGEFAALLIARWSDWYAHLARLLSRITTNGVTE